MMLALEVFRSVPRFAASRVAGRRMPGLLVGATRMLTAIARWRTAALQFPACSWAIASIRCVVASFGRSCSRRRSPLLRVDIATEPVASARQVSEP